MPTGYNTDAMAMTVFPATILLLHIYYFEGYLKGGDMEKLILSLLCKYLAWVI